MNWTDDDVKNAWRAAFRLDIGSRESTEAIMTHAVELAAARGGTMTAEELRFTALERVGMTQEQRLREHIAAQGARVATLEQERDEWREKWQGVTENAAKALEHVSELEKSLDGARKERDDHMRAAQEWGGRYKTAALERDAALAELENVRPFEALHADLSKQLRDAWEATGVAGTVKGMTTLADVIGVTKADLLDALADNAAKYEALAPVAEQVRAVFEAHHAPSHCALGLNLKVAHGEAIIAASQPHPGAALLEELERLRAAYLQYKTDLYEIHKVLMWAGEWPRGMTQPSRAVKALLDEHHKALARAKNEGLEMATKAVEGFPPAQFTRRAMINDIRAMKEIEQDNHSTASNSSPEHSNDPERPAVEVLTYEVHPRGEKDAPANHPRIPEGSTESPAVQLVRLAVEAGLPVRYVPLHIERVEERNEAVKAMHPNGHCTCAGEGTCEWCDRVSRGQEFDRGAESMRAACLTAVQFALEKRGAGREEWEELKAAIEGATP